MANDPLTGIISDHSAQTVVDFLGRNAPLSFTGQPALPTGAPAPGVSAAPAGASGVGATPASSVKKAPGLQGPDFGSFGGGLSDFVGGGGIGGGEGSDVGAPGGQGPGSGTLGFSAQFGPLGLNIGPTGTVGVGGRTGNQFMDFALAQGLNFAHVPTSINIPSLIAGILGNPALASAFGLMGLPFEAIAVANMIASMSPTSVVSLQAALADPNPEMFATPEVAQAIAEGKQMGPVAGTPMTQGTLGWSPANTATGPRPNDPNEAGIT